MSGDDSDQSIDKPNNASQEGIEGEHQPGSSRATRTDKQILAYSGPLPSPEILKGFEEVLPGAAERIMQMAEKESRHRHGIEQQLADDRSRLTRSEFDSAKRAQWMTSTVSALAIVGGCVVMVVSPSAAGAIGAVISVSGVAGIFGGPLLRLLVRVNTESNPDDSK